VYIFRLALWAFCASMLLAAPAVGATRTVCASGCMYTNLQPAIDAAQPGDTILLRAGQTFSGNYTLKKKSGTAPIVIRSDAPDTSLPAAGVRLVPSGRTGGNTSLSSLARLRGQGSNWRSTPIIRTESGAHDYRLQFLEIDGKNQEGYETLIALGNNTTQTSTGLAPYRLTLDRLFIHGDPVRGQKRCLALDSASTNILNSYFEDCKHFASDAQAIAGFNGPGPFRIDNNHVAGSTENILFGGSDPRTPNLVPSDITITRNTVTKPLGWRNPILARPGSPRVAASTAGGSLAGRTHYFKVVALLDSGGSRAYSAPSSEVSIAVSSGAAVTVSWSAVSGATGYRIYRGTSAGGESVYRDTQSTSTTFTYTGSTETSGTPRANGTLWTVKNTIELKNAQRVTIQGNIIENIWRAGQNGYALVLTPRNQGNNAPWTVVQDVVIRSNIVRHANGGLNILGRDYSSSTGSLLTRRITIAGNVFADIGGSQWGGGSHFIMITGGPSNLTVDHNTVFHTNHIVLIDGAQSQGFVFTNNLMKHNTYGIFGSNSGIGNATLAAYFPSAVVRRNVLAGGSASLYPTDNFFPDVPTFYGQFVDYSGGNYALKSNSPYIARATDGKNIGADLTALKSAQTSGSGVTTTNAAPTASPGGPYSGQPGRAIAFNGSSSKDSDGTIASYRWDWGDGTSTGSGATPSHTYASTGSYTVRLTVTDNVGATGSATTTASVNAPTTSAGDIVLTAADVTVMRGGWARISSTSGSGGQIMSTADNGWSQKDAPLAAPANYFDVPFMAAANTNYRVWLRMRARSDSWSNDSTWVQFTGAVTSSGGPLWRTGTTSGLVVSLEDCSGCGLSGWGWQDRAYWISAPPVRFQSAGPQTVRIQTREDGLQIDQIVLSPVTYFSTAPGSLKNDGTKLPRTAATLKAADVVLRADDSVVRRGNWTLESDSTGADGRRLGSVDRGWSYTSSALAAPANYVDLTFTAVKGVRYRTWLRLSSSGNSKSNDSVWVQYDRSINGSGNAVNRIGTTAGVVVNLEVCSGCGMSGWGWADGSWWTGDGFVTFSASGTQRLRIQTREDGVRIDQIVISPSRYMSSPPGPATNDRHIVRPDGTTSTY
jgi:PKD repeat protein